MFFRVLIDYTSWHYGEAMVHYLRLLKTAWWFAVAYFSMPLLLQTLLAPYRRLQEERGSTLESWLASTVMNILSRIVGTLVRSVLLLIGFLTLCLITIVGLFGYFAWLILPAVPSVLMLIGFCVFVLSL